jgi:hypothetical protein
MSISSNRATLSLLNMTNEMFRKNIEISRITKTCTMLLLTGISTESIDPNIILTCIKNQKLDGGFVGNTDTIWNAKLLEYYPRYNKEMIAALKWINEGNFEDGGFGRSKRDMHRIPVTGLALYLLPQLAKDIHLEWLENTWLSEVNSLTYKAAYTLLAFDACNYVPNNQKNIEDTAYWLASQQEENGGFAPWLSHPVGDNIYCTAVATLALISVDVNKYEENILKAYNYMLKTQLKSGIWPYHEIEDGASWGLLALTTCENVLGSKL